jgi:arylsulfatase A-like enzyme
LVLFCSDHGDYCADHGLFCKGVASFRGAYNVPLIARWPRGIKNPGRRVEQFVSLADIAPTLQELAGVASVSELSGRSLTPFFRNETPDNWRTALFTQFNGVELYYTQRSVRTKEYLYVFNGFDYDELYDLRHDPHEMHNKAADPACEGIKAELAARMWEFAYNEQDGAINDYITVALAPVGPERYLEIRRRHSPCYPKL